MMAAPSSSKYEILLSARMVESRELEDYQNARGAWACTNSGTTGDQLVSSNYGTRQAHANSGHEN
jgi:hypothetical protein